jgi:hypothetical protein
MRLLSLNGFHAGLVTDRSGWPPLRAISGI